MSSLDPGFIQRAAPAGSMRYFSLLYTDESKRDALAALYVIAAEIHASATEVSHEVAHTRLQWWRAEIDRLMNRNAQHPATRVLQTNAPSSDFSSLHELNVAADMDLLRMTYNSAREFEVYLDRSGGVLGELIAQCLLEPERVSEIRSASRQLFKNIRRVETMRDLAIDAKAGRIYWPLDALEQQRVALEELQAGNIPHAMRELLVTQTAELQTYFSSALKSFAPQDRTALRPIVVLAHLNSKLLNAIARANHDVSHRHELGSFSKVWTAWRAARSV